MNPKNKKAFIEFVTREWKQDKYKSKLVNKVLFVACEEECHQITLEGTRTVEELLYAGRS